MSQQHTYLKGPDGKIHQFPKSMPMDTINANMRSFYGEKPQESEKSAADTVNSPDWAGSSVPVSPELRAKMDSRAKNPDAYDERVESAREMTMKGQSHDEAYGNIDQQARNVVDMQMQSPATRLLPEGMKSKVASARLGMVKGGTLGFDDEIIGGSVALLSDQKYADVRDSQRTAQTAARAANPVTHGAGEIAGSGWMGGAGAARVGVAKSGAMVGGAYGVGSADGTAIDRVKGGAIGAAGGAVLGKLGDAGVQKVAKVLRNRGNYGANGLTERGRQELSSAGMNPDDFTPDDLTSIYKQIDNGIDAQTAVNYQDAQALGVPMSKGDITRSPADQRSMSLALTETKGQMAHNTARVFKADQNKALSEASNAVSERVSGQALPSEAGYGGGAVAGRLRELKTQSKKATDNAYDEARNAEDVFIPREHMQEFVDGANAKLKDFDADLPGAERIMARADEFMGNNTTVEAGLKNTGAPIDMRGPVAAPVDNVAAQAQNIADLKAQARIKPDGPKKPMTQMLKGLGGIDPDSVAAGELRNMGITSRTAPGLFRKGGVKDLDNIPLRDSDAMYDNFAQADGNSQYAKPDDIYEALGSEMAGKPLRSNAQTGAGDDVAEDAIRQLDAMGDTSGKQSDIVKRLQAKADKASDKAESDKLKYAAESDMAEMYDIIETYDKPAQFDKDTALSGPAPAPEMQGVEAERIAPSPVTLKKLEGWRKRMSRKYGQLSPMNDKAERAALMGMMKDLDKFVDDSITNAIASGSKTDVAKWKRARGLYSRYAQDFLGKEGPSKVVAKMTQGDMDASAATQMMFGKTLGARANSGKMAKEIKRLLGEDSEEWGAMKAEALMMLLNQNSDTFSGARFNSSLQRAQKQAPEALREFFTPADLKEIKRLARVSQNATTSAPGGVNHSQSATFAIAQGMGVPMTVIRNTKLFRLMGDIRNNTKLKADLAFKPKGVAGASRVASPAAVVGSSNANRLEGPQ